MMTLFRSWVVIFLLAGAPGLLWATKGTNNPPFYSKNPVLALIDGQPLLLEEIQNKSIYDLRENLHQELQLLLMQESLKRLALKHKEIDSTPTLNVSAKQIEEFYKANKLQSRGPLDKLKSAIEGHLQEQMLRQSVESQYNLAIEKGWVKNYLEPPTEFLVVASAKGSYIRGNAQAKVMFLEFSDYQCPFCGRIQDSIKKLMDRYGKKVAFGYKHFPLSFHTEADEAAIAAECAREQGKFEEMHHILYANQKNLQISDLKDYAKKVKVKDTKRFDECLDKEQYRHVVNNGLKEGASLGITGTPGFVIGVYDPKTQQIKGETLSGALPLERFEEVLKKYLD